MSRTVVRVSAFLVAISLALAAMRAYSDEPPKNPADDDPFGEGADAAPAVPAKPVAPRAKCRRTQNRLWMGTIPLLVVPRTAKMRHRPNRLHHPPKRRRQNRLAGVPALAGMRMQGRLKAELQRAPNCTAVKGRSSRR